MCLLNYRNNLSKKSATFTRIKEASMQLPTAVHVRMYQLTLNLKVSFCHHSSSVMTVTVTEIHVDPNI